MIGNVKGLTVYKTFAKKRNVKDVCFQYALQHRFLLFYFPQRLLYKTVNSEQYLSVVISSLKG